MRTYLKSDIMLENESDFNFVNDVMFSDETPNTAISFTGRLYNLAFDESTNSCARPHFTAVIGVTSGLVLGFHIGLEPSGRSILQALNQALYRDSLMNSIDGLSEGEYGICTIYKLIINSRADCLNNSLLSFCKYSGIALITNGCIRKKKKSVFERYMYRLNKKISNMEMTVIPLDELEGIIQGFVDELNEQILKMKYPEDKSNGEIDRKIIKDDWKQAAIFLKKCFEIVEEQERKNSFIATLNDDVC
jgi:hypothetical protein